MRNIYVHEEYITFGTRSIAHNIHEQVNHVIYNVYMFNFEFKLPKDVLVLFLYILNSVGCLIVLKNSSQIKKEKRLYVY